MQKSISQGFNIRVSVEPEGGSAEEQSTATDTVIDALYEQISQRKHLSNYSFRYQSGELDALDAIYQQLDKKKPGRISKNDVGRMALIVLCQDYKDNGDQSFIAQVLKRM